MTTANATVAAVKPVPFVPTHYCPFCFLVVMKKGGVWRDSWGRIHRHGGVYLPSRLAELPKEKGKDK